MHRYTYADFHARVHRLAWALERMGVQAAAIASERCAGTAIGIWSCTSRSPATARCCTR